MEKPARIWEFWNISDAIPTIGGPHSLNPNKIPLPDENEATLTITPVRPVDAGEYAVVVWGWPGAGKSGGRAFMASRLNRSMGLYWSVIQCILILAMESL
ncbi:MAG: hypothetical protein LJE96_00505 [Deltaproteobacteria bacterium]|nr:hypothetical protein [Deltaproteobacteria bacterium]